MEGHSISYSSWHFWDLPILFLEWHVAGVAVLLPRVAVVVLFCLPSLQLVVPEKWGLKKDHRIKDACHANC